MPNYTENYNLKKPLQEEFYNIEDHNGNMDIIDEQLKKLSETSGVVIGPEEPETGDVWIDTDDEGDDDSGAVSEVFVATYGVTTYAEIKAAYDAGKVIFMRIDNGGGDYITAPMALILPSAEFVVFCNSSNSGNLATVNTYNVMSGNWTFNSVTVVDRAGCTMTGALVANQSGQDPSTSQMRNSKLVTTDTNPTVNGEICWVYE